MRRAFPPLSGCVSLGLVLLSACGGKDGPTGNNSCEVTGVTVTPTPPALEVGATASLTANISQTNCSGLSTTWSSSNSLIASVSGTGVVTGVAAGGPVTITATVSGKSGTVNVTVIQAAVASVTVTAPYANMPVGGVNTLTAVLKDARGAVLTGRTINWSSGNTGIVSVAAGVITGVALGGPVTITATSEGQIGTVPVTVVTRYGYTFANNASATAPYDGNALSTYNTIGAATTITRVSTGTYDIRWRNMAAGAVPEVVLANAIGTGNKYCYSTTGADGSGATQGDYIARVECRDSGGALFDQQFIATLFGKDAFPGRFAFALADQPSVAGTYAAGADRSYNPAGQVQITRTGVGTYNVQFVGNTRSQNSDPAETFLVTPAAGGIAKCEIPGWSYSTAQTQVRCADPLGAAMDSQFQVVMLEAGRPGVRHALAWVHCNTGSCNPTTAYARSTGGGTIAVTRTATGSYSVLFPGLARTTGTDNVLVTSYGSFGGMCKMVSVDNSGADLVVVVQCFGPGSSVGDGLFDIAVVP